MAAVDGAAVARELRLHGPGDDDGGGGGLAGRASEIISKGGLASIVLEERTTGRKKLRALSEPRVEDSPGPLSK